jgi:phosphate transport system permease protein
MRWLLFFCGAVSIVTTVGIVLVLGSESLRLFTSWNWANVNNTLDAALDATAATLTVTSGGHTFAVDQVLRVNGEIMRVTQVLDHEHLVVERGAEGTQALAHEAGSAISVGAKVSPLEFLTSTRWLPQAGQFGILPLLLATLITSLIAMLVAIPVGLGAAIYISEYASPQRRAVLKPILEILAGVPTVVYGFFALTVMTPVLRAVLGSQTVQIYNMASAGLVMGVMIIPTISSISEDALSAVPRSLREASYGLGATRLETIFRVLLPAALSGIVAAFILGISRAVGETMIVALAAGAGPNFTLNPFEAAETMTGHIARISGGDLSFNSVDYNSIFSIGLALFVITLVLNVASDLIIRRFREVYA